MQCAAFEQFQHSHRLSLEHELQEEDVSSWLWGCREVIPGMLVAPAAAPLGGGGGSPSSENPKPQSKPAKFHKMQEMNFCLFESLQQKLFYPAAPQPRDSSK